VGACGIAIGTGMIAGTATGVGAGGTSVARVHARAATAHAKLRAVILIAARPG
jgi:hypothetical protein